MKKQKKKVIRKSTQEKIIEVANYIIDNNATNAQAAEHFNVSKSCIKKYINNENMLISIDEKLYNKVKKVKDNIQMVSKLKGGQITRNNMYKCEKEKMIALANQMIDNNMSLLELSIKSGEPMEKLVENFKKIEIRELKENLKKYY